MRTRLLSAIAAGATLFALGGCEVENCKEGEVGCINGPPDDGLCHFDLVADEANGICLERGQTSDPEPLPDPCNCSSGEVCRADLTCQNICQPLPNAVEPSGGLPACRPLPNQAAYTFQEAALAACYQECARRAVFCGTTCNPEVECAVATVMQLATSACAGNVECAMQRCETARDLPCQQYQCAGNAAPNCTGVACSKTCSGGDPSFANDGVCDDGDLSNAESAICAWGTDCGDCGPRRGTAPSPVKDLGDQCVFAYQCGANPSDFTNARGWCVTSGAQPSIQRCIPDCSLGRRCPAGFECRPLEFTGEDGTTEALEDDAGRTGRACFPLMCGGI